LPLVRNRVTKLQFYTRKTDFYRLFLGGTLDITAHQILEKDYIAEIYRASGSDLGGYKVNQSFERYLKNLFGEKNITKAKRDCPNYWIEIMEALEKAKKSTDSEVSIKPSENCPWNRQHFDSVTEDIKGGAELKKSGRLVIPFNPIISEIITTVSLKIKSHMSPMIKELRNNNLHAVLLVGGFSNSQIIIDEMKVLFEDEICVIVPENSELCVVKGAVMFGWKRDIIRSRKSRYTYGFGVDEVSDDTHEIQRNIFDKLVTINEELNNEHYVQRISVHPHSLNPYTKIALYCSKQENPKLCDEEGTRLVGVMRINNSPEKYGKQIKKTVYFGDTEIHVNLTDVDGETHEEQFDFLVERTTSFS